MGSGSQSILVLFSCSFVLWRSTTTMPVYSHRSVWNMEIGYIVYYFAMIYFVEVLHLVIS